MKRMREIILDFTPLLDITLIILFYFILFSHMGAAEAQQRAEQAEQQAHIAQSAAAEEIQQAAEMQQQAAQQLAALAEAEGNQAAVAEALTQFANGENLKLRLYSQAKSWKLLVMQGTETLGELSGEHTEKALSALMHDAGFQAEQVILCDFVYTATEAGSNQAYHAVDAALEAIRAEYPHLYISETDLSLGKDEKHG